MATNDLGSWSGWSVRLILRGEPIVHTPYDDNDPLVVFTHGTSGVVRRYRLTTLLGLSGDPRRMPDGGIVLDLDRAGTHGPTGPGVGLDGADLCQVLRCVVRTLGDLASQGREGGR